MEIQAMWERMKDKITRDKTPRTHTLFNPHRDWGVLLSVFVFCVLLVVSFSGWVFLEISKGELFFAEEETGNQVETIDRTLLKDTLLRFEEKEQLFEVLKNDPELPRDPSL